VTIARLAPAHIARGQARPRAARRMRALSADLCACVILSAVIPLAIIYGTAGQLRPPGPGLPAMAALVPAAAALIGRTGRDWEVLVAGLAAMGLAGQLGDVARTFALTELAAVARGAGAGLALAGAVSFARSRGSARARRHARPGVAPGPGAVPLCWWWAAVTVSAVICAPVLGAGAVTGERRDMLTGGVLAAAVLGRLVTGRSPSPVHRGRRGPLRGFHAAQRAQLALISPPVTALGFLTVAVRYRSPRADAAAVAAEAVVVVVLAAMAASRRSRRDVREAPARRRTPPAFLLLAGVAGCTLTVAGSFAGDGTTLPLAAGAAIAAAAFAARRPAAGVGGILLTGGVLAYLLAACPSELATGLPTALLAAMLAGAASAALARGALGGARAPAPYPGVTNGAGGPSILHVKTYSLGGAPVRHAGASQAPAAWPDGHHLVTGAVVLVSGILVGYLTVGALEGSGYSGAAGIMHVVHR
jgi:hypothetical protein